MTGLYFHVPFCKKKCDYCDFYSVADLSCIDTYVRQLCIDIDTAPRACVDTVFFGGGTPSLLSCAHWRQLSVSIRAHFDLDPAAEITVECNPESITKPLLQTLREEGVNRISIGVQSLQDTVLRYAGRIHSAKQALDAVRLAKAYFDNVSCDYILGFPCQTPASVVADLTILADSDVRHISTYALQVEEGTPLAKRLGAYNDLPDVDAVVDLYDAAYRYLVSRGFARYEISNFAQTGYECRHNLHCWQYQDYLGYGCNAHSFYLGKRYYEATSVHEYCQGIRKRTNEAGGTLPVENEQKFEMIMLALRTQSGLDLAAYQARFGTSFAQEFASVLAKPNVRKATEMHNGRFYVLSEYLYVCNTVLEEFLA